MARRILICVHTDGGACITSQSISYVYATDDMTTANVAEQSRDDVFLTMLVLHQKSTCMLVNEANSEYAD